MYICIFSINEYVRGGNLGSRRTSVLTGDCGHFVVLSANHLGDVIFELLAVEIIDLPWFASRRSELPLF